jgi:hypothetical protein
VCNCCRVAPKNLGKILVGHLLSGSGQEFVSDLTSTRTSLQHPRYVTRLGPLAIMNPGAIQQLVDLDPPDDELLALTRLSIGYSMTTGRC